MIHPAGCASTGSHADIPASRADFNIRGPHGSRILDVKTIAPKVARCEQRDYQLDKMREKL
jgi:hypothetical protein